VNVLFCEEKQKVGLFVYHREGLRVPLLVRVPQFGNHCFMLRSRNRKFWKVGVGYFGKTESDISPPLRNPAHNRPFVKQTTFIIDSFITDNLQNESVMNVVCQERGLL